jgi:hypothetical protein
MLVRRGAQGILGVSDQIHVLRAEVHHGCPLRVASVLTATVRRWPAATQAQVVSVPTRTGVHWSVPYRHPAGHTSWHPTPMGWPERAAAS